MSQPQCLQALAYGNEVRLAHAAIRREVREGGPQRVAEMLLDPDDAVGSMRLERLLTAMPRYGQVRSDRLLRDAGMVRGRLTRRVRELTTNERERLAGRLA